MKSAHITTHRLFWQVAAVAALAAILSAPAARAAGSRIIGQTAPEFTLKNAVTGASTSLTSLRAGRQATVIMFIATRCPISNAYNGRFVELANEYASKGVDFVGINSNETEPVAEVASHAQEHKFTFPVLKDPGCSVADAYGASHTPEVYVVDSKGTVVYHGRIDNNTDSSQVTTHDLATALDQVLAGKTVSPSETKAFGCTIKRSH